MNKGNNKRKEKHILPSSSQPKKNKRNYICGVPGPPSSLSPLDTPPPHSSSGGFRLVLMRPTLVSVRYPKTASVAFSFQSHLTEGALGCFHPNAFPLSFQNHLICCSQAWHSMEREWRPPRATSIDRRPSCGLCPSGRGRLPRIRTRAGNIG